MTDFICPQANVCIVTTPRGPECGTVPEHVPPLAASRALCGFALRGQMLFEQTNADEWHESRRLYRTGSALVDLAMSLPRRHGAAADYFDDAAIMLNRAHDDPAARAQTVVDALLLSAYLPTYRAIQADEPLSDRQRIARRNGLAQMVRTVDELPAHESIKRGLMHKLILPLAMERSHETFLPGLARQTYSRMQIEPTQNHDGTLIIRDAYVTGGYSYVPVKARGSAHHREKTDGEEVLYLPMIKLMSEAYPDGITTAQRKGRDIASEAVHALEREALSGELDAVDKQWLDQITRGVLNAAATFVVTGEPYDPFK